MASTALVIVVAAFLLFVVLGGLALALTGGVLGLGVAGCGLLAWNDKLAGRWLTFK